MASVGDMIHGFSNVLTSGEYDIVPVTSGEEWAIHNIYLPMGSSCELYINNGSDTLLFAKTSDSWHTLFCPMHSNMDQYITVKNIGASTIKVSFDGAVTAV